jgi:hypothetical protein
MKEQGIIPFYSENKRKKCPSDNNSGTILRYLHWSQRVKLSI